MKRKVTQIRDLNLIENELNAGLTGVLAFTDEKETMNQYVLSYIYSDKNIYIIFNNSDEIIDKIVLNRNVNFIIFKNEGSIVHEEVYKIMSVKCSGIIKKVEESRIAEELVFLFNRKYQLTGNNEMHFSQDEIILMIDTEEIQAAEITGK